MVMHIMRMAGRVAVRAALPFGLGLLLTLTVTLALTSPPAPVAGASKDSPACATEFSDVPLGSTFHPFVHCLACAGIVSGYSDGTFGPNNQVTRGQLSKIVSGSAAYSETFTTNTFEDVPVGSTFFLYVERLYAHGGIAGYPCGGGLPPGSEPCNPPTNRPYFRPSSPVTRGQTAKIVSIARGLPAPSPGRQTFEDVAPNSTFWTWIEPLAATGAIGGYPCGGAGETCNPPTNRPYFRPGAGVTRGQSSKIVVGTFFPGCLTTNWITNHDAIPQTDMPRPQAGVPYGDPRFGTMVTRISDARAEGLQGLMPEYSKREPWNSDESLLILRTGNGDNRLYDGSTYTFIKNMPPVGGEEVFWHATDPSTILYVDYNTLHSYNVNTDEVATIASYPEYTFIATEGEGNLSRNGRWFAFAGEVYNEITQHTTIQDLLVLDLTTRQVTARLALPPDLPDFDWISISPLGNYVVVNYAGSEVGRYRGLEVYDRNLNFMWQLPLGYGHSDLGVDANGDEVLVFGYYDAESNTGQINKYRLSDGTETRLLEHDWQFYLHISCRNEQKAGWCFISTYDGEARLTDDPASWLPFEDEVFALKLDGSGDVQRIAHHHSRRFSPITPSLDDSVYWAEPHATVSRRGDRILWGSNWRQDMEDVTGVDTYVADWRP